MTHRTCHSHQLRNTPDGVLLTGQFIQQIDCWRLALKTSVGKFNKPHLVNLIIERGKHWLRNYRTRRQLAAMTDYQRKDIGVDRCMVDNEISKPFWRD